MSRAYELLSIMTPIFRIYVEEYGPTPGSGEFALLSAAERHLALAAATEAIAGEARSGETVKQGSTGTASTRAARHRTTPTPPHQRTD